MEQGWSHPVHTEWPHERRTVPGLRGRRRSHAVAAPDGSHGVDSNRWPIFLPDGKHFLYLAANLSGQTDSDALYAGSLDSTEARFITKTTGNAAYAAPGYLLFSREKTLYAQKFDAAKLVLSGEAVPLLRSVSYHATHRAQRLRGIEQGCAGRAACQRGFPFKIGVAQPQRG